MESIKVKMVILIDNVTYIMIDMHKLYHENDEGYCQA